MSRSATQAYNLEKRRATVIEVYAIAVEIRDSPFNPGVLCAPKCLELFTHKKHCASTEITLYNT